MKFYLLIMLALGHSMVCSDNSKICFMVIFSFPAKTEPIVREFTPPLLPSQRACDVTGRVLKSKFIIHTLFFLDRIHSIDPKIFDSKQIFGHDHNENTFYGFPFLCL